MSVSGTRGGQIIMHYLSRCDMTFIPPLDHPLTGLNINVTLYFPSMHSLKSRKIIK